MGRIPITLSIAASPPTRSPTASMSSSKEDSAATIRSARRRSSPNVRRDTKMRPTNTRTHPDTRRRGRKQLPSSSEMSNIDAWYRPQPTEEPMRNRPHAYLRVSGLWLAILAGVACSKSDKTTADTSGATATAAVSDTSATKSLYDRLGGKPAITAVIDTFVAKV